jgi:hypothetical protein
VATASLCWGITVFGGFLVARWWHELGPAGPWTAATIYGIILGIFMLVRFRRGRWREIDLDAMRMMVFGVRFLVQILADLRPVRLCRFLAGFLSR